jgi:hypothetical protein
MKLEPYRDGTFRWRVYFDGEVRDVYARNQELAKRLAEYAQRLTNAPKKSRKAYSVVLLDPATNRPATPEQSPFQSPATGNKP